MIWMKLKCLYSLTFSPPTLLILISLLILTNSVTFASDEYDLEYLEPIYTEIPSVEKIGEQTAWLEFDVTTGCLQQNAISKLLICYPNHLNSSGNAKPSRRFQMQNQVSEKFAPCKNHQSPLNGTYSGLLMTFEKSEEENVSKLMIEGSSGFSVFCELRGGQFAIQLRTTTSLFSLFNQCPGGLSCKKVSNLGNVFTQSANDAFLDDYVGLWSIGMEMLQYYHSSTNKTDGGKNDIVVYHSYLNCSPGKINFTISDDSQSCIGRVPELKNQNQSDDAAQILEFRVDVLELVCNQTMLDEEEWKLDQLLADGTINGDQHNQKFDELLNRAYFGDQEHTSNSSGVECNQWNSAMFFVCFDGLLDPKNKIAEYFELDNVPNNKIAALCTHYETKDGKMHRSTGRHGFAVGACANRANFTRIEGGAQYQVDLNVRFNVSLSYSHQIYHFDKQLQIIGNVVKHYLQPPEVPSQYQASLTIQMSTNEFKFAKVVDPQDAEHNFAKMIEAEMHSEKPKKFKQIAQGPASLGLLGVDFDPQRGGEQNIRYIQIPANKCKDKTIVLLLNGENEHPKLKCYVRPAKACDEIGRKLFDKLKEGKERLLELMANCTCPEDEVNFPPLPTNIHPEALKPSVQPPLVTGPMEMRKRRSVEQEQPSLASNYIVRLPECDDTDPFDIFYGEMLNERKLDKLLRRREECCEMQSIENTEFTEKGTNKKNRQKRQLQGLPWEMPVPYCFDDQTENRKDKRNWRNKIRNGLIHISSLSCVHFRRTSCPNEKMPPLLYFQTGEGCSSSNVGLDPKKSRHVLTIGPGCDSMAVVAHEVLHALGFKHEQSRSDRNEYVWVNRNAILPNKIGQYERNDDTRQHEMPYDFGSVMHYGPEDWRKGGSEEHTMLALDELFQSTFKQRDALSFKDAKLLNLYYCSCNAPKSEKCHNGGYLDPKKSCEVCRCPAGYTGDTCQELDGPPSGVLRLLCGEQELHALPKWNKLEYPTNLFSTGKCIWRIRIDQQQEVVKMKTRVQIEFEHIGFKCQHPCSAWLEVKYKTDKTATGARICCKNERKLKSDQDPEHVQLPIISAEKDDTEVILMLHDPEQKFNFKLRYRAELPPHEEGTNCPPFNTIDRPNPEFPITYCGGAPCSKESTTATSCWGCDWHNNYVVNGNRIPLKQCTEAEIEKNPHCSEKTCVLCLTTSKDGDQYYWENADGEMIRVYSFDCMSRGEEPPKSAKKSHISKARK